MTPAGQYFRANTGLAVVNREGKVLLLERIDIPGAWQLPQGGLDELEDPREAALRELHEETGIEPSMTELLAEYPEWLAYELPPDMRKEKTGRGQVQRWFVLRFLGEDSDINLKQENQEFSRFQWVEPNEAVERAVGFRSDVYRKVMQFVLEHQRTDHD